MGSIEILTDLGYYLVLALRGYSMSGNWKTARIPSYFKIYTEILVVSRVYTADIVRVYI